MTVEKNATLPLSLDDLGPSSGTHNVGMPMDLRGFIKQAELALQQGDSAQAVCCYTEAIDRCNARQNSHPQATNWSAWLRWLHAHRGDSWARVGGWEEAEADFEEATRGGAREGKDYAWAWAHWGEMLRLKARDDEETRADHGQFETAATDAIKYFDRAILAQSTWMLSSTGAQPSQEASPQGAQSHGYGWALAHRAALGVLCWLYYVCDQGGESGQNIPSGLVVRYAGDEHPSTDEVFADRVDRDFEWARKNGADDAWVAQFEALWLILTSARDLKRLDKADALIGRALITGAASFPLEAGMVLAALFACAESQGDVSDVWLNTALRRANDLLLKDPTHPTGHATLAAIYQKYANEEPTSKAFVYRRAFESSLEVLRMNRDLLNELIAAVDPGGIEGAANGHHLERAVAGVRSVAPKADSRKTSRGYETSFIAGRIGRVVGKRRDNK